MCRVAIAEGDDKARNLAELSMIGELMKAQFGSVRVDSKARTVQVDLPSNQVSIDVDEGTIVCEPQDPSLELRVQTCLDRMRAALQRFSADSVA